MKLTPVVPDRIFFIHCAFCFIAVAAFQHISYQLRLWVNTGTVNVSVAAPDAANTSYVLTPNNNTLSNTCPLMINYQEGSGTAGTGLEPTVTVNIVACSYIGRGPVTSFNGVNLAPSAIQVCVCVCVCV